MATEEANMIDKDRKAAQIRDVSLPLTDEQWEWLSEESVARGNMTVELLLGQILSDYIEKEGRRQRRIKKKAEKRMRPAPLDALLPPDADPFSLEAALAEGHPLKGKSLSRGGKVKMGKGSSDISFSRINDSQRYESQSPCYQGLFSDESVEIAPGPPLFASFDSES